MARLIIEDSSTGRNTQPAMSGNTRELANSLVEMKIASGVLLMPDAGASQGEDNQKPPRDASDSQNPTFHLFFQSRCGRMFTWIQ